MDRKEFLSQVGISSATFLLPACFGILAGCTKDDVSTAPTNVDFTLDVSTGALSSNGGYLIKNGLVVARTTIGSFLAVSAACTHEGTTINFVSSNNSFKCPNHGATFGSAGQVTKGPASRSLKAYKTTLTGNLLRVFS